MCTQSTSMTTSPPVVVSFSTSAQNHCTKGTSLSLSLETELHTVITVNMDVPYLQLPCLHATIFVEQVLPRNLKLKMLLTALAISHTRTAFVIMKFLLLVESFLSMEVSH